MATTPFENIGLSNAADAFYRYKMPKLITKIEGKGNGIKTKLVNITEIAKAIGRSPEHLVKFITYELATSSKKTDEYILNGSHSEASIKEKLYKFIEKYIQCFNCKNPETTIEKTKKNTIVLMCKACGAKSTVDMNTKFANYFIKH